MRIRNDFDDLDTSEPPECLREHLDWQESRQSRREPFPSYTAPKTSGKNTRYSHWPDEIVHRENEDCTEELSSPSKELDVEFQFLVKKWRKETAIFSSVAKKIIHPSYQRIIGMGKPALPLILKELQRKPSHWFWALNAISGEDPVSLEDDFDAAVQKWLEWGKDKGYL